MRPQFNPGMRLQNGVIQPPISIAKNPLRLERGSGRRQSEAIYNFSDNSIYCPHIHRILHFNEQTGLLSCGAGVTLEKIGQVFRPQGWCLAVTPTTDSMSLGDAVAFDIHGHNHHRDGSFCRYVRQLTLVLASGETVFCSRAENSDLFWATVGGMGLTGTIVEVELFLHSLETGYYKTLTLKTRDLLETLALFEKHHPEYQYAVAWIDCLASGDVLGRSLLTLGNEATWEEISQHPEVRLGEMPPRLGLQVPFDLPLGILNRYTVGLYNELYYHHQRSSRSEMIVDYDSWFHPIDSKGVQHRINGKAGIVQYQFVLPTSVSREGLTCILKFLGSKGCCAFSAALKRLGNGEGWLSFPLPGYSLALNLPMQPAIGTLIEQLDRIVLEYGGRVDLTTETPLRPQVFRQMYPNYDRWLSVKSHVDPQNRIKSALSDRLQIQPRWQTLIA